MCPSCLCTTSTLFIQQSSSYWFTPVLCLIFWWGISQTHGPVMGFSSTWKCVANGIDRHFSCIFLSSELVCPPHCYRSQFRHNIRICDNRCSVDFSYLSWPGTAKISRYSHAYQVIYINLALSNNQYMWCDMKPHWSLVRIYFLFRSNQRGQGTEEPVDSCWRARWHCIRVDVSRCRNGLFFSSSVVVMHLIGNE